MKKLTTMNNSRSVNFIAISIMIISSIIFSDAFEFEFEEIELVDEYMDGETEYTGLSLPRNKETLNQLAVAAKDRVGAVFNSDLYYTPPIASNIIYDEYGACSDKAYHVMHLNTKPEMWIRPADSTDSFYIMIRPRDKPNC